MTETWDTKDVNTYMHVSILYILGKRCTTEELIKWTSKKTANES